MWTLRSCKGPLRETSGSNIKIRRFHILRHGLTTSRNIASGARPNPEQAPAAESRLRDCAAKKKSGRLIPIHPSLRTALAPWRKMTTGTGPIIQSERGGPMTPVSIVNWFAIAYRAVGLAGCSSHSGRRTFITRAARLVHKAGGSLRDVQLLAGHRSIQTTQRYIDGDTDAQRKLVSMI